MEHNKPLTRTNGQRYQDNRSNTMTITENPVDNGVNVEALLGAREAMTAMPAAAAFTWRASSEWVNGTHCQTTIEKFFGVGDEQSHNEAFVLDTDHPRVFAADDHGVTPVEMVLAGLAGCLTAGVASVAQNRGIQLRRSRPPRRRHGPPGHPRHRQRRPERLQRITVSYEIDADATPEEIRAVVAQSQKRSAVYDVITNPTTVTVEVAERHEPATDRQGAVPCVHTTVTIIGAGQAGLAMSRCLTERSIDHVRARTRGGRQLWRSERWDSLRLLTPNWMTRLPGLAYQAMTQMAT